MAEFLLIPPNYPCYYTQECASQNLILIFNLRSISSIRRMCTCLMECPLWFCTVGYWELTVEIHVDLQRGAFGWGERCPFFLLLFFLLFLLVNNIILLFLQLFPLLPFLLLLFFFFPLLFFFHFIPTFCFSETGSKSTIQAGVKLANVAQDDLELQTFLSQLSYCREYRAEQPYVASKCVLYYQEQEGTVHRAGQLLSFSYLQVYVLTNSNSIS